MGVLKLKNLSLLGKWWWRLKKKPDALWTKVIKKNFMVFVVVAVLIWVLGWLVARGKGLLGVENQLTNLEFHSRHLSPA